MSDRQRRLFEKVAARLARHPEAEIQAVGDFLRSQASKLNPDEADARLCVRTLLNRVGLDMDEKGSMTWNGKPISIDLHHDAADAHADNMLEAIAGQAHTVIADFVAAGSPNFTTIAEEFTPA